MASSCDYCSAVGEQIASRRITIFGHIARLSEEVPAHQALRADVNLSLGRLPGRDWKCRPGWPNNRWVDQVRNDTGNMPSMLWRSAILRGHGTRVTQRPSLATRTWWWWWWRRQGPAKYMGTIEPLNNVKMCLFTSTKLSPGFGLSAVFLLMLSVHQQRYSVTVNEV